jgi:multimeric flavodoxin WrbA
MTEQPLILLASARKQGDTRKFVDEVFADKEYKLIDFLDFPISPYSYLNNYPNNDKFFSIIDELIEHNVIVFATPVYWYAMSGLMKTFFDRFTDTVTTNKHLGRQLHGRSTFLLAVGADKELPDGFEIPFKLTSDYLNMKYQDCIYYSTKFLKTEDKLQEMIQVFKHKVKSTNR